MQVDRMPRDAPSAMRSRGRRRARVPTAASAYGLIGVACVIGFLIWCFQAIAWYDVLAWVQSAQRALHLWLTHALRRVAAGSIHASWGLIGLSLVYGVLHAVGPGHGKAVIATYLGSSRVLLRRGMALSVLASLLQGLTAIVLVEVANRLLGLSMRHVQGVGATLENASFALVALLGAALVLRSLMSLWRQRQGTREARDAEATGDTPAAATGSLFAGGGRMQAYCDTCGAMHGPTRQLAERALSLRTALAVILSVGLRPCTGAVLVLLVAYALNMRWSGMAAAFAMSVGTAATVAALAAATVHAREGVFRLVERTMGSTRHVPAMLTLASLAGGMLLLWLGLGLLIQGMQTGPHPLLMP